MSVAIKNHVAKERYDENERKGELKSEQYKV